MRARVILRKLPNIIVDIFKFRMYTLLVWTYMSYPWCHLGFGKLLLSCLTWIPLMQENRGSFTTLNYICLRLIPGWVLTGLLSVTWEICSSSPCLFNFGICPQRRPLEGLYVLLMKWTYRPKSCCLEHSKQNYRCSRQMKRLLNTWKKKSLVYADAFPFHKLLLL